MDSESVGSVTQQLVGAGLEHLTGPMRGTVTWLFGNALDVSLDASHRLRVQNAGSEHCDDTLVARLHRCEESYDIEAIEGHPLWINGTRVTAKRLQQHDVIELGDTGPLSRFKLHRDGASVPKTVASVLADCLDYMRVSRKPLVLRSSLAIRALFTSLTRQTTILFRSCVIIAIVALAVTIFHQGRANRLLQQQVESDTRRLQSFGSALARARSEALSPADLNTLRQELGHRLSAASERLAALEARTGASARVIAVAMQSIVFLQGSYGFQETQTKRMLRHLIDDDRRVLFSPFGQPALTLEGDGPVAERQFTGTAFVATESGALVTNRHVALPWEDDAGTAALAKQGLEPVMIKFVGYLPGRTEPFAVELIKASDDVDLAVLQCDEVNTQIPHLNISDQVPKPGDEVIVMGYPTGLKSMLAQTGDAFIDELQDSENLDFWAVAKRLSEEQFIHPLASRGIVGQVTKATIVYDAETTHGGSGGPVLDVNSNVIAVNAAIIPEYGGSNLGVPAGQALRLLKELGLRQ